MSFRLFAVSLITFYLAFNLQQTNATILVESATAKALVQSACSASDSPPACYAVLNPIANNPNLNPTDICSAALKAATNVARVTHNMLNMSSAVASSIARDPSVRQSIVLCSQQYAQVLDFIDKSSNALTQHVDEDKVPEYLSSAIAAVAKCDASAAKVANTAMQITNKNLDCSKLLKNALSIFKVFAEYIENPSHDPKQITAGASGHIGGNLDFNAGGSGGISGLSSPTNSPTSNDDASAGNTANNNNMKFSFAKSGEFKKEFSANGNIQSQPNSPGSTPQKISTQMKFEGLGMVFGKRIKGVFNPDSEKPDSESIAGAPQTEATPSQISTTQKFEGLGLGFGDRFKGLFNPDSGNNADPSLSATSASEPQTTNTPSQISTNLKFEGLGLGFGHRIKGLFHHDTEYTDTTGNSIGASQSGSSADATQSGSSADASQSGSSTDASQSGSSAGAPDSGSASSKISTSTKFEGLGLGFGQHFKGFLHRDHENTDPGSAGEPQSGSIASAPDSGSTTSPISTSTKLEGLGLGFGQRFKGFFHHDSTEGSGAGELPSGTVASAPDTGSTPSQISTSTKFEGLGLGFGQRFKGLLHHDSTEGSGAGELPSGTIASAPDTGSTPSQISTSTKFEGLGLGFGQRFKGLLHPDTEKTDGSVGEPQSGSIAGAPDTGSIPSQISTSTKFEGTGLGFGKRMKGFLHPGFENPDESNTGESQSGSIADAPVSTGLKFSLSGFAKSFTSSKKHKEHKETGSGSPSPAPAKVPSSSGGANTPSAVHSDASNDGANSYSDDDVTTETTDSPSPSPSGKNSQVKLKYSLSNLIPDT